MLHLQWQLMLTQRYPSREIFCHCLTKQSKNASGQNRRQVAEQLQVGSEEEALPYHVAMMQTTRVDCHLALVHHLAWTFCHPVSPIAGNTSPKDTHSTEIRNFIRHMPLVAEPHRCFNKMKANGYKYGLHSILRPISRLAQGSALSGGTYA